MNSFFQFLSDRLKEKSTWMGIGALASAVGIQIHPEYEVEIVKVASTIIGAAAVLTREKKD